MPDRRAKILRIVCLVLGGILALQLALFAVHAAFNRGLTVPALPALPPGMEANSSQTNAPAATNSVKPATNSASTNAVARGKTNSAATNSAAQSPPKTNVPASAAAAMPGQTNLLASGTNHPETEFSSNAVSLSSSGAAGEASVKDKDDPGRGEEAPVTNRAPKTGTNLIAAAINVTLSTTNAAAPDKTATNSSAKSMAKKGPSPGGKPGAASKIADLPAPVKERIDRITQGEILAPVMRPLPMALLGIGGQSAFLRSADGQTGLIKEGDQLGTLKLLRIGTNRVLIEVDGEKKELMIFAGLGSESLLPKPDKTTNAPPKKSP